MQVLRNTLRSGAPHVNATRHGAFVHTTALQGFAASAADQYEQARPDYTVDAVQHVAETIGTAQCPSNMWVLELGAGTGKFTRGLLRHVPAGRLIVTEPAAMRSALTKWLPTSNILNCPAEKVSLPAESCHAVVAAQAFHWFANQSAVEEIHRLLRPQGRFGLTWNIRDTRVPWVAALDAFIDTLYPADVPRQQNKFWQRVLLDNHDKFTTLRYTGFDFSMPVTPEAVVSRVLSLSVVACLTPEQKAPIAEAVRRLLAEHPDTRKATILSMPHVVETYWTQKR